MDEVERAIRAFLSERVLPEDEVRVLDAEADLLRGGILTSLTLVHLVDYLEEAFTIAVLPSEFSADNFRTIHRICAFIEKKRGAAAAGDAGGRAGRAG